MSAFRRMSAFDRLSCLLSVCLEKKLGDISDL